MRILPTRSVVAGCSAALLLVGLAGCGNSDGTAAANPAPTSTVDPAATAAPSDAPAALTPASTGNPFTDLRTAAMNMPQTADTLSGGIARAAKYSVSPDADAATLRANLTYLLTEHVYLAGVAVTTAYHSGAKSDAFKTAAKSLDDNSVALGDAVSKVVGADQGKVFLDSWRSHVTDFVNYAVGAKTGGAKGAAIKTGAMAALRGYAKNSGAFFSENTKGALAASAIEKDTLEHINTLAAAVDDLAAARSTAYATLKTAADHMAITADLLAGGLAKTTAMKGSADDRAATLRANLTGLLTSHVYLAGISVFTAYTDPDGVQGTAFQAAAAALDKNSVELSDAVRSISDATRAKTFLQVWRTHITDFVDYAVADAGSDGAAKNKALGDLDAYRSAAGQFFSTVTGGALPAPAVADAMKTHVESFAGAIDSLKGALVTG